jgi:hypothetical protein
MLGHSCARREAGAMARAALELEGAARLLGISCAPCRNKTPSQVLWCPVDGEGELVHFCICKTPKLPIELREIRDCILNSDHRKQVCKSGGKCRIMGVFELGPKQTMQAHRWLGGLMRRSWQ